MISLTGSNSDLASVRHYTTFTTEYAAATGAIAFGGTEFDDGVHLFEVKAYSTVNVALYEGDSSSAYSIATIRVTKWTQTCEDEAATLVTATTAYSSASYYRIGTSSATESWPRFTMDSGTSGCNVIYTVVPPTELVPWVSQPDLTSFAIHIPVSNSVVDPDTEVSTTTLNEALAGEYTFAVTSTTVKAANHFTQTTALSFTFRVSDPDCEAPTTVTPISDHGVAVPDLSLLAP